MRHVLLALALAVGCVPAPVVPPPDGPGDCATTEANLRKLGGCGIDLETFAKDCAAESQAESEIGVRLPLGCLSAGQTCAEEWSCK